MDSEPQSLEHCAHCLTQWLDKCNTLHGNECHVSTPIAERSWRHIPDWVIDTKQGCIVPGKSVDKYAALSYVWSPPTESGATPAVATNRLMLQRNTVQDLSTPGFLFSDHVIKQLPTVVRDSIFIVTQSGERYLWVDCLCILQNDESTKDKVAFLPEIYSGAFFTIIAAANGDGLRGSPDDLNRPAHMLDEATYLREWLRKARLPPEKDWDLPEHVDSKWHFERRKDGMLEHHRRMCREEACRQIVDVGGLHEQLLTSHWATRGWTFQEHLLSKRSIVFLNGRIFWDCQGSVWTPKHHEQARRQVEGNRHSSLAEKVYTVDRHLSRELAGLSAPDFSLYRELVCRYNHRNLTYAEDALRAFSGVLDAFSPGFCGGFVSGLPALFLDSALLWQPLLRAGRRIATSSAQNMAPTSPLPSWSWVGWQCLVDPESLDSCLEYEVDRRAWAPSKSWKTRNIVEWQTMDTITSIPHAPIDGPGLLEAYKSHEQYNGTKNLPTGWSFKPAQMLYGRTRTRTMKLRETTRQNEARLLHFGEMKSHSVFTQGFIHAALKDRLYRWPLPLVDQASTGISSKNVPLLTCITSSARFRVRRTLIAHRRVKPGLVWCSALSVSVLETHLYRNDPETETCCPVVTFEDDQGRWAGAMKVTGDIEEVDTTQPVVFIVISSGSCSYREAANTYEATIDTSQCYKFLDKLNGDSYHFQSYARGLSTNNGNGTELQDDPESDVESQNSTNSTHLTDAKAGQDLGPFVASVSDHPDDLWSGCMPDSWNAKTYEFYNVLWVQIKENIMYRVAAGRVPKDVWEQNHEPPERVVLG